MEHLIVDSPRTFDMCVYTTWAELKHISQDTRFLEKCKLNQFL